MKNKNDKGKIQKKDLQVMLKETGVLFAITLLAGLLLGFVHQLTLAPIEAQQIKKITNACQTVFQDADSFLQQDDDLLWDVPPDLLPNGVELTTIYEAKTEDGSLLGYVLAVNTSEGYAGSISIYMGVRLDGTLNGISILDISETPGLGMEAENVLVPQFAGKQTDSFSYTKSGAQADNQIDAISGATFTTEAVVDAVNGGLQFFKAQLQEGISNE